MKYYNPTKNHYIFDYILLEMVQAEKNITLLLNCTCMDAAAEEGQYAHGRGDSILAPLTGAECKVGRECDHLFGNIPVNILVKVALRNEI